MNDSIKKMLTVDGIYLVSEDGLAKWAAVLVSAGKCCSLKMDIGLREDGWKPNAVAMGPLNPSFINLMKELEELRVDHTIKMENINMYKAAIEKLEELGYRFYPEMNEWAG